jgi:hypothetical protein
MFYVQGILGDRVQEEDSTDVESTAIARAKSMASCAIREYDSVRVITDDGELVYEVTC